MSTFNILINVAIFSFCFYITNEYRLTEPRLKIGSFNVQTLGPTKMSRPEFVDTLTRILSKYDIVLIQEIRDSSSNMVIMETIIKNLNKFSNEMGINYTYVASPRLGKGTYKEQLAFVFRSDKNSKI